MNQFENAYAAPTAVAHHDAPTRAEFIRKTYYHLAGALGLFTLLVFAFCSAASITGADATILDWFVGKFSFIILLAFCVAGWLANSWAHSSTSLTVQYLGLALYTIIQATIFTPLTLLVI